MLKVKGLDHIVLRSPDIEASIRFYCDVLGMEPVRVEDWREGKVPFPSVRIAPESLIDLIPLQGEPGADDGQRLDHVCLVVEPGSLEAASRAVQAAGVKVTETMSRFGAQGQGLSFYFQGPEDVTIEVRHYPDGAR